MADSGFFTYMLQCGDGTLYTGWSTDVEKRLATHNAGKGAKYTRVRLPVKLMGQWRFESKAEAMRFEWHLKRLPRLKKLALCSGVACGPAEILAMLPNASASARN